MYSFRIVNDVSLPQLPPEGNLASGRLHCCIYSSVATPRDSFYALSLTRDARMFLFLCF